MELISEHMNSIMNNFFHDPFSQRNESGRNMNQQISTRNDPFGDPFSNFQNSIISHQRQNSFGLMEQMMGRNMNSFMVIYFLISMGTFSIR